MEIVINTRYCPCRTLKDKCGIGDDECYEDDIYAWCPLIGNGGVKLPKGHGRLIAEPTKEEIEKTVGGQSDFAEYGRDCVKAVLDNTKTIIPADTSESGGEE